MNTEVNNQEHEPTPIEIWEKNFRNILMDAHAEQLFAPDVLLILQRACVDIQHQINRTLYTHEHIEGDE